MSEKFDQSNNAHLDMMKDAIVNVLRMGLSDSEDNPPIAFLLILHHSPTTREDAIANIPLPHAAHLASAFVTNMLGSGIVASVMDGGGAEDAMQATGLRKEHLN